MDVPLVVKELRSPCHNQLHTLNPTDWQCVLGLLNGFVFFSFFKINGSKCLKNLHALKKTHKTEIWRIYTRAIHRCPGTDKGISQMTGNEAKQF